MYVCNCRKYPHMKKKNAQSNSPDTERFSIASTARSFPQLPYKKIKNNVLGRTYYLSLVFIGERRAQGLNLAYRGKAYVPNVLSFPLSEESGEMFICPIAAAKEADNFELSFEGYIGFLYIHGLLHLAGYDHGDEMDRLEQMYLLKFKLT